MTKHGQAVKPPEGFGERLRLLGRDYRVRYFETVTCEDDGALDGKAYVNRSEVWVATQGTSKEHLADVVWHEICHIITSYLDESPSDEAIALLLELCQPALLRENRWLWELFKPKD